MSKEVLRQRLQAIVENIEAIQPIANFNSHQWIRGNANIRRVDRSISTLNVNIKNTEYGVGIDGSNKSFRDNITC